MKALRFTRIASTFVAGVLLQACSLLPRLDAVPSTMTEQAVIPGIPNARYWADRDLGPFVEQLLQDLKRWNGAHADAANSNDQSPSSLLAISGGGDAGAFAAGLLAGWAARGTRPEFRLVTGVSAGALIAPFAFLGPEYDDVVRTVVASIRAKDIFRSRNFLTGLVSDGMADSKPLSRVLEKYVTPAVLSAIAAEYAKGRALYIGTTDLDSGRTVSWNMGAIAASGAPGALDLFRKVLIAAASIPGVVSPVMIDVAIDGKRFQEMHADGGVITQVFLYPPRILAELQVVTGVPFQGAISAYVIRNGKLQPEWEGTRRRTFAIATRSISALIQTQGINDVERIYRAARRDGVDFNLAYIESDFTHPHGKEFDPDYMKSLFDYSYRLGANGYAWHKTLPREAESEPE